MKLPKHNTSGYKGVSWDKYRNKRHVKIEFKGKAYYLGRYLLLTDAIDARAEAGKNTHGKFLEWYESSKMNKA